MRVWWGMSRGVGTIVQVTADDKCDTSALQICTSYLTFSLARVAISLTRIIDFCKKWETAWQGGVSIPPNVPHRTEGDSFLHEHDVAIAAGRLIMSTLAFGDIYSRGRCVACERAAGNTGGTCGNVSSQTCSGEPSGVSYISLKSGSGRWVIPPLCPDRL